MIAAEHEAIVDRPTWVAVQAALAGDGKPRRRSTRSGALLAGILRCARNKFVALHPSYAGYSFLRYGENAQPHNEPDLLYMDPSGSELWIEASEVHFNADAGSSRRWVRSVARTRRR